MLVRTGHRGLASGCDIEVTYTGDEANANLYSKAVAAGWVDGCNLLCTINAGVDLYSTNDTPGFQISHTGTDMGFTSGTEITIINNGSIWGKSGTGGAAATSSGQAGSSGGAGGTALKLKQNNSSGTLDGVIIHFTNNGTIKGGGGGGGGGGAGSDYQSSYGCTEYSSWYYTGGINGWNWVRDGCDGAGCAVSICGLWWNGTQIQFANCNACGCGTPGNVGSGSYTYYAGTSVYNHNIKNGVHFVCQIHFHVRRSWGSTCYTQHYHGDGGSGGAGADWDSNASGGNGGAGGSPNGNGTEDGGNGGPGSPWGVTGNAGNNGGGGNGGAGGAAGYYLNYNVGNTSGWTLVNNGTVAGQVG